MDGGKLPPLRRYQYLWALLGLTLLWPAALNGGPFYMTDSGAYLHYPAAAIEHLTGHTSEWAHPAAAADGEPKVTRSASARGRAPDYPSPYPADAKGSPTHFGRSIYYGALIYLGYLIGGFWLIMVAQALLAGAAILLAARHFAMTANRASRSWDGTARAVDRLALGGFAVALLTPLPYFVCFIMPDFVGGLACLAAVMLLAGWREETGMGRVAWTALLVLGAVSHSGNVVLLTAIALAWMGGALVLRKGGWWRPGLLVVAAASLGLLGDAAFSAYVTSSTGRPPIPMPFVSARLIADGPGAHYLRAHCPQSGFVLCRSQASFTRDNVAFLWNKEGAFGGASPGAQRLIAAEQPRFVATVAGALPIETAAAAARNALRQLGASAGLSVFNYTPAMKTHIATWVPPAARAELQATRADADTMPVALTEFSTTVLALAAAVILVIVAARRRAPWRSFAVVTLTAFLLNTLVFGCLSMPDDRYGARVIWVLPLIATFMMLGRRYPRTAAPA